MVVASAIRLSPQAYALDPTRSLSQYNVRSWTRQNGFPANGITALAQTTDGYLWMGTRKGLVRFDGVDFKAIDFSDTPGVRYALIRTIAPANDGGLWVGLENSGFGHFDGHVFSPLGRKEWGGEKIDVREIAEDPEGWVWLGTPAGVSRIKPRDGAYEVVLLTTDDVNYNITGGMEDARGRVWFGSDSAGVHMWDHGQHTVLLDNDLKHTVCWGALVSPDGDVLVATSNGVMVFDEHLKRKGTLVPYGVRAMLVDHAGAVWIGGPHGLTRYWHGELTVYDGVNIGDVTALCEDREGSLWVGMAGGLAQITDVKFPILPAAKDPTVREVYGVCASPRGGAWGGTAGGVTYYHDGTLTSYREESGLPETVYKRVFEAKNNELYAVGGAAILVVFADGKVVGQHHASTMFVGMAEDNQGVIVSEGGNLFRATRSQLTPYPVPAGAPPMQWILNLLTAHDGALWVASVNGAFRIKDGHVQHWGKEEGIADPGINTLAEDADGVMWLATLDGIVRVKDGHARLIGRDAGLFDINIYAIVPDDFGDLWIDAGRGIFRVSRQAMNDVAEGRAARVACTVYDGQESVDSTDKQNQEHVGAKSIDGRIWFATAKGVMMIDPAHIPRNASIPPVRLERIEANGVELRRGAAATVKPGRGELQFQFTALSFIAPQKIQFRYRLTGYDADWITVTNRRFAAYNNLRPGRYTFEVTAANADGAWNPTGDSFTVQLLPHFYQTIWFTLLGVVGLLGVFGGVFAVRVRRLKLKAAALQENRLRLEAEVRRRTAELAQANDELKHEVDERKNAERQLQHRTDLLEAEIDQRKQAEREVERVHRELLETSRLAGMAEVATGVLHNVGNVLNSVNVSAAVVIDRVRRTKSANVGKLAALLEEHAADLGQFFAHDHRGQQVPVYLRKLADHLDGEQAAITAELEGLLKNVSHINEIVALQQNHAKAVGLTEIVPVTELIEDSLRTNRAALDRHGLTVVRDFQANPSVAVERHKVLQILINLIRNAKYACDESGRTDKVLTLRVTTNATHVQIAVIDNGVGIPPENLTRIFGQGFTTRKDGHGFGLHTSALAAQQLGGTLTASSEGPGRGARFTLTLSLPPVAEAGASATAVVAAVK